MAAVDKMAMVWSQPSWQLPSGLRWLCRMPDLSQRPSTRAHPRPHCESHGHEWDGELGHCLISVPPVCEAL